MPQATETVRRRRRQPEPEDREQRRGGEQAEEHGDDQDADASTQGDNQPEDRRSESDEGSRRERGGQQTLTSELKDAIREAAIEVLRPVARKATTSAAKYAVTKGPELVKDKVVPKVTDAGGAAEIAKGALSKGGGVAGGVKEKLGKKGGGKAPTGTGRGRRLPVQEFVDVAVPLQTAYDQWTQFEEFPRFMHRVERIEQRDDQTLMWHENIWGVRRSWEAEILEQTPCERIVWRSKEGPQTIGVVTFHQLSDRLTRIYVTMDFQPQGWFEKASSGMRISRRALKSDLMRFKAFVELRDEATGAWRGRIEEGEVEAPAAEEHAEPEAEEGEKPEAESPVATEAVGEEAEEEEPEEPEAEAEEEPEAEAEEEPEAEAEEEPEAEAEEEPREEEPEEAEPEGEAEPEEEEEEAEEPEKQPAARRRGVRRRPPARPSRESPQRR